MHRALSHRNRLAVLNQQRKIGFLEVRGRLGGNDARELLAGQCRQGGRRLEPFWQRCDGG